MPFLSKDLEVSLAQRLIHRLKHDVVLKLAELLLHPTLDFFVDGLAQTLLRGHAFAGFGIGRKFLDQPIARGKPKEVRHHIDGNAILGVIPPR